MNKQDFLQYVTDLNLQLQKDMEDWQLEVLSQQVLEAQQQGDWNVRVNEDSVDEFTLEDLDRFLTKEGFLTTMIEQPSEKYLIVGWD